MSGSCTGRNPAFLHAFSLCFRPSTACATCFPI
nr:MAG TPA: hypothetical protein [Caudoviricetes sp.]